MADEELAPEGGEALELAPETPEIESEPAADPIADLASEMGWVPKEQYRGDPEKWRPADEFIREGRNIQRSMSDELRSLRGQMETFGRISSQLVEDKAAERDNYWRNQHRQAVEEGDLEGADKALGELRKLDTARTPETQGPSPEVNSWIEKNPWYRNDPLAQARAFEICERLKHLPVAEQLAQAERGIRKEFPEHFPAPAKTPPSVQTGQARNPNPSNRAKAFADMPQASQQMARDMVRRNPGLTLESIASSYWADQANQRRA